MFLFDSVNLKIFFFNSSKFPSAPGTYKVLDTDYDNYSAVYSCDNIPGIGKYESGWVLTRSINPSQEGVRNDQITKLALSYSNFIETCRGIFVRLVYSCYPVESKISISLL